MFKPRVRYIVVGIGLNVNRSVFQRVEQKRNFTARSRHGVVAGRAVRGFAKIARPGIQRTAGKPGIASGDSAKI
jgi:hypothetical protein